MLGLGINKMWSGLKSADGYAVNSLSPKLAFDFEKNYYRVNGGRTALSSAVNFSRNGNATMVDSGGLIKWAPHNLVTYSEDFSQGIWSPTEGGVKTSTTETDPAGGSTAVLFTSADATSDLAYGAPVIGGAQHTLSFYAKLGTATEAKYRVYQGGEIIAPTSYFNQLSSEWALITVSFTPTSTGNASIFLFSNSAAGTIYFAFPHLYRSDLGGMVNNPDRGDSYVPTTSSAVYLPRRGHHKYNGDQWVNKGILVESEARTNLVAQSTVFSASNNISVVSNSTTAPDGSSDADEIKENTANSQHNSTKNSTQTGTVTHSIFAKKGSGTRFLRLIDFNVTDGAQGETYFNLTTGTIESGSGNIESFGNGWYRCSITVTLTVNSTLFISLANAVGSYVYTGDGTSSLYVWGVQTEAASTPSSYIPTNGASVTRAAETVTVPYANLPWPTPTYIGDNVVLNGTFDTDLSNWSLSNSGLPIGWIYESGKAKIDSTGIYRNLTQASLTIGKVYELSFDKQGAGTVTVYWNGLSSSKAISGTGNFSVQLGKVAGDSFTFFAGTQDLTIDNISVREINPLSVSIAMMGEMDYADTDVNAGQFFVSWTKDASNLIQIYDDTRGTDTGQIRFNQTSAGVVDVVDSAIDAYSPDINVPFNIASRHGSTFINGAVGGVALTADTTPVALPDLSTTNLSLAYDFMGTISEFRIWDKDLGDTGIAEATKPSLEPSLSLTFDGQPSSFTNTGLTL